MITLNGDTITRTDPYRYKFDDAMAEYLYGLDFPDEYCGDADYWSGWTQLWGKRLLRGSTQGFVWCELYPSPEAARSVFDAHQLIDSTICDEVESESDYPDDLSDYFDYLSYCEACAMENLECFTFRRWLSVDQPKGPLG